MKASALRRWCSAWSAFAAVLFSWPHLASAYEAAGDRTFPAMILLPQIAPADQIYLTPTTQPVTDGQSTDLAINFAKRLTERLGVRFEEDYFWLGRNTGWQNLNTVAQYLAILDPIREALVTVGVDQEWGGTGARRIGAAPQGATTPTIFFGKGMGDLDIGYLRPFAFTGVIGYQFADSAPRSDNLLTDIAVEYSIPYLQSKVRAFNLPDLLRGMTPLVEAVVMTPTGANRGSGRTNAVFGPGVNYSGEGWEFTIEALIPAGPGGATGLGVAAQLNISLDYFFPDTIGKPLFSAR
jgi:hypothetical protein